MPERTPPERQDFRGSKTETIRREGVHRNVTGFYLAGNLYRPPESWKFRHVAPPGSPIRAIGTRSCFVHARDQSCRQGYVVAYDMIR
jgi:hypothetical protein